MDQQAFLDAQLWLRRVASSATGANAEPTQSSAPLRSVYHRLLPKKTHSAAKPEGERALICWGCFHVDKRFCYFQSNTTANDQTQFRVELLAKRSSVSPGFELFVRFKRYSLYKIDAMAIQQVVYPTEVDDISSARLPPYGCLDFGSVTLRMWLEPLHISHRDAHEQIATALRLVESERERLSAAIPPNGMSSSSPLSNSRVWQRCFRHNEWVDSDCATRKDCWLTPSILLRQGHDGFQSEADRAALTMAVTKILRSRHQASAQTTTEAASTTTDRPQKQSSASASQQDSQSKHDPEYLADGLEDHQPLTPMEVYHLVSNLVRMLGDDHVGLSSLLGTDIGKKCGAHGACTVQDSQSNDEACGCIAIRWSAWDEFLQHSDRAIDQPHKRNRSSQFSESNEDNIQKAAVAFKHAKLSSEQYSSWRTAIQSTRDRIDEYERAICATHFSKRAVRSNARCSDMMPSSTGNTKTDTSNATNRSSIRLAPAASRTLSPTNTEHLLSFLLESHRAVLRQELAVACLPRVNE